MIDRLKNASDRIRAACLKAADPGDSVRRALEDLCPRLETGGRLIMAAAGKASRQMAEAALERLGTAVADVLIVAPHGYDLGRLESRPGARVIASRHPVPDRDSVRAAQAMRGLFNAMEDRDVCLFLLSGGGSSLLCLPQPPLTLEDKIRTTDLLLKSGADIRRINAVRKHLSGIKGGRLVEGTRGTVLSLIVSDVVGDDASFVASGPSLADPSTFADAEAALRGSGIRDLVPIAVRDHIEKGIAGIIPETPKAIPARHEARVICSNSAALAAASREAQALGFQTLLIAEPVCGEAREAGRMLAQRAREAAARTAGPLCIIAGGETTVTVRGKGRGGRNQEAALSAAVVLDGVEGVLFSSFATDGIDGVTEAAGACASGATAGRLRELGMDPEDFLSRNDSNAALMEAGELIITGPTHTNVNDVCIVLIEG